MKIIQYFTWPSALLFYFSCLFTLEKLFKNAAAGTHFFSELSSKSYSSSALCPQTIPQQMSFWHLCPVCQFILLFIAGIVLTATATSVDTNLRKPGKNPVFLNIPCPFWILCYYRCCTLTTLQLSQQQLFWTIKV